MAVLCFRGEGSDAVSCVLPSLLREMVSLHTFSFRLWIVISHCCETVRHGGSSTHIACNSEMLGSRYGLLDSIHELLSPLTKVMLQ